MFKNYGMTDVGRVRTNNEDYFLVKKINKNESLFIIADGMGGHQAGDVASSLGANTFAKTFKRFRTSGKSIIDALNLSLQKANNVILKKATEEPDKNGMGTTFSALVIKDMKGYIIHIGDSRIYMVRDNKLKQLTTDHTFVEKMVEEGRITREEARVHPHRNILYYSLGAKENLSPQIIEEFDIKDKDAFLMCSDGLSTMIEDKTLKDYCLLYSPEKAASELINLANNNGGNDNITVQVIHFGDVALQDKTVPLNVSGFRMKFPSCKKNCLIILLILSVLLILLAFIIS